MIFRSYLSRLNNIRNVIMSIHDIISYCDYQYILCRKHRIISDIDRVTTELEMLKKEIEGI